MYSLTVADHVMIAHSFRGEGFGPAQRVHGATFVVEAEFRAPRLDDANLLVDIAAARVEMRRILDSFDYNNLDTLPAFAGQNTTTEFLCFHVHSLLCTALAEGKLGAGGKDVRSVKVLLRESPLAWAAYEAEVPGQAAAA
jgi:6-pyruvoyl-tetrahydropterin synthase